ncbi:MAG: collagen-like protein [Clostridia bacterium]|nr:collagen-like protein [Clostridia bacterium]
MTVRKYIKNIIYSIAIVAIIAVTAMIGIAIIGTNNEAGAAKSLFKNGNGTADSPYEISNVEEFNSISYRLDAYYVQTANIDFTDQDFYSIGDYSHPFTGHYDGQKFLLSGINAGYDSADYTGVFAFIYSGAKVSNVRVENSHFIGRQNVGAIAGLNAGTIDGCVANAKITVSANSGGGITGANSGVISRCVNAGNIDVSFSYAGGISGTNSGVIQDSYNKGNIVASIYAGGISGINSGVNGVIERAFQVGGISANAAANITGDNLNGTLKQCRFIEGAGLKNVCVFNSGKVYSSIARPQSEFNNGRAFNDWQNFNENFMYISSQKYPILRAEYVEVDQVGFQYGNSVKLKPGESIALGAHVLPAHASVQEVSLSIESGAEYCSLKDGEIVLNEDAEAGEYVIVKGQAEGKVGYFTIEIAPIRVEKVSLISQEGKTTVAPGSVINFDTLIYPTNASIKDVRYISSSPFADIDAYGRLKMSLDAPVGLEVTVTASSYDNISIFDSLVIKVVEAQVKSVEVTNSVMNFKVTHNLALSGVAVTESLTTQDVEFEIVEEATTALGARIINGVLYADMPGDICVVAKYAQEKSAPVLFKAEEEPVKNVVFRNSNTFSFDSALNLIVETSPENATYDKVEFSIIGTNTIGAEINGNTLTAKSAGLVTVKAEARSGVYAIQTIYVRSAGDNSVKITDICLEKDSFVISRSLTLVPVIEPREAQATVFFEIFSDGGTGVELVDGRLQNAKREGEIILKAYTSDYQTYISVDALKVEVENVYFANANRFKVTKGLELVVATNPSNPTYPQVEYEIVSSTAEDAEINGTFLTAKSIGQVTLRAWVDGVSSKLFEVYVDKEPVTDVKFTSNKKSFKHTESLVLEAMAFPMQATFKDIEFFVDESLTDKRMGAKITDNVLTAEIPGTVIVSMKCDGHIYSVVIEVEKEPVIAVSALNTNVLSANSGETVFRTSGVLELSALLYPQNATNRALTISIERDNSVGAVLLDNFYGLDFINRSVSSFEKTVVAGEKVYLSAQNPGNIMVTVTPLDNVNIATVFTIEVKEEPVADIFFCLDKAAGTEAANMREEVEVLQEFDNGYYQYDQMFVKANQVDSRTSSLSFSVFTYAQNRAVTPTFDGKFKLYYYTDYNDCLNGVNAKNITDIVQGDALANNDDYLVRTSPNFLSIGTRKREIWITAEAVSNNDTKAVSQPLKLTIYPTNIMDLKTLYMDNDSGILSANTNIINDMSGYEVSVKFKANNKEYGFTQFIPTNYTKLGLKLFRYSISSFDVSVKVVFDVNDPSNRYDYNVPIDFDGIQLIPTKQLEVKKFEEKESKEKESDETDCENYVVFYDLYIGNLNSKIDKQLSNKVKYVYLYGKSDVTHNNFNFTINNGDSDLGMTLHNISFVANEDRDAICITGGGTLNLNVVGERVSLQGGKGLDGANGKNGDKIYPTKAANGNNGLNGDANWNPMGDVPHGQPGADGADGLKGNDGERGEDGHIGKNAIKLGSYNNINLNVSCNDFKLKGGQGGNGGNGGNGSKGQSGGYGGRGGNGSYKYLVVAWTCGHGGDGGNGGDGGDGGNAGDGGNRGAGGVAVSADNSKVPDKYTEVGAKGEKAGTAGTPGEGGNAGLGGLGGLGHNATVNRVDGSPGVRGSKGEKGAYGSNGV